MGNSTDSIIIGHVLQIVQPILGWLIILVMFIVVLLWLLCCVFIVFFHHPTVPAHIAWSWRSPKPKPLSSRASRHRLSWHWQRQRQTASLPCSKHGYHGQTSPTVKETTAISQQSRFILKKINFWESSRDNVQRKNTWKKNRRILDGTGKLGQHTQLGTGILVVGIGAPTSSSKGFEQIGTVQQELKYLQNNIID